MSSLMREYSEKRDFIRMHVDTDIELSLDEQGTTMRGRCIDLSATGMLVEVGQAVGEGTLVHTSLPSHNSEFPPFDTYARVLRSEQLDENSWQLGLQIEQVKR